MYIREIDGKIFFINENKENAKYQLIIEKKLEQDNNNTNYSLRNSYITGKYIVDTISGKCNYCGIKYSISENSILWKCPICNSIMINKESDILINTIKGKNNSITLKFKKFKK